MTTADEARAQLLEEYHAALQSYIFEGQSFWNRITAFVLLNSALLVARGAMTSGAGPGLKAGVALLGLAAAALWAHTALRAHFIIELHTALLADYEARLDMSGGGPFQRRRRFLAGDAMSFDSRPRLRLPWYARGNVNDSTSAVLTAVFAAVWIVVLVQALS